MCGQNARLLLLGSWSPAFNVVEQLHRAGYSLTLQRDAHTVTDLNIFGAFNLVLAAINPNQPLEPLLSRLSSLPLPWLAWMPEPDPTIQAQAYRAGALAVMSGLTPTVTVPLVRNALAALNHPVHRRLTLDPITRQRDYRDGDLILLDADDVLEVQQGVVALMACHSDGLETLLGLYGPRQWVVMHPNDECGLQLVAHTHATLNIYQWVEAVQQPLFTERLRAQLQQLEAWAVRLAHPHTEQRILGILELLAEQFGRPHAQGMLLEVRLTHQQLASAVGATRQTVTRLLGQLRALSQLAVVETPQGERFCLPHPPDNHHCFVSSPLLRQPQPNGRG